MLEYEYPDLATAVVDVARWQVPAQGSAGKGSHTIRSAIVGGVAGFTSIEQLDSTTHVCRQQDLLPVKEHPLSDKGSYSREYFMIMRCSVCSDYWGIRYQYDPGTGVDDRYHRYGSESPTVKIIES